MRLLSTILLLSALPCAAAQDPQSTASPKTDTLHPRVKMSTTLGEIILELDAEKAPISVDNFIQYAESGYYNGTIFHRVMPTFMIQGGGFTPDMEKKTDGLRDPIKNEWKNGLKNKRGAIAMARTSEPDSATSQFFIDVVDNTAGSKIDLDTPRGGAAYCVFGQVVEGMDVVDAIRNTKTIKHPKYPARQAVTPETPVVINSVTLATPFDRDKLKEQIKVNEQKAAADATKKKAARTERAAAFKKTIETGQDADGRKVQQTDSGLKYIVLTEGAGPTPEPTDTVVVHYTGWLYDTGKKFDSSHDHPAGKPVTYPLKGFVRGWAEGVGLMKVGGKRRLIIPGDLAYGPNGNPRAGIKPNATLVFDVELIEIK